MENKKIDKVVEVFRKYIKLKEEIAMAQLPTNNIGSANISGTPETDPGNPPVFRKKRKNIYLGIGSRKRWMKPK